jgi:hypothetical protein
VLVGPERKSWATWRLESVDDVLPWLAVGLGTLPASDAEVVQ